MTKPLNLRKTAASDPSAKSGGTGDAGFAATALCESDGRLLYLDPALVQMLAYPPDDLHALNLFDLLADPHDKAAVSDTLREDGCITDYATSLHHGQGSLVPARLSIQAFECGGATRLMALLQGYSNDCEKQQQAEARYHLIFNSVPVGITITDRAGNFIAFNPAFSDMVGYPPAKLRNLDAITLYQDAAARKVFVDTLYQKKTLRNFETTLVRSDGKTVNVLLNADLIDIGHLENAMLSSVRDITVLKTIEAQLIRERDFSETILDTSDSLIVVFDRSGHTIKFNKACTKTTGYTLDDMLGQPFWDILSPDPAATRQRVTQLLTEGHIDTFESYWKTKGGGLRLIKWASVLLVDEDGRDYIVSTGSDITENRKAHEALRQANRELEASLQNLEEKTQAISLLADMEGFLQGCRTAAEVCVICAQFVQSLCPQSSGAVYLIDESRHLATAQEMWGDETVSPRQFKPSSCWSVRRGRTNLTDSAHPGLPCPHISAVEGGQYLCIPMEANGELLGILHASYLPAAGQSLPGDGSYFESKLRLLTTAAETTALSLSNIALQETLRQQSIRDALTGIFNRRYMVEALTRELSRAQREQIPVSVLMFDIDHFKAFNDTYGHDGGDTLLYRLAEFFRQNTRAQDILCRYGGEEFVIVMPHTRHSLAMQKADALRIGVSRLSVQHEELTMRACTISIGVATFPVCGMTADDLLRSADKALYAAKRAGRNRVISA